MEENFNWNLASNNQLREECELLEKEFEEKQAELKKMVNKIEEINGMLTEMSRTYNEVKAILNKREGKENDGK